MTWLAFGIVEVAAHERVVIPTLGTAVPCCAVTGIVDHDGWWQGCPLATVIVGGTLDVTTAAPDIVTGKGGVQALATADGLNEADGGSIVLGIVMAVLASFVGGCPV